MSEISAFARGRGICFARMRGLFTGTLFFVAACLMMPGIELTGSAYGQVTSAADAGAADDIMFTAEDLGSLVAPIALYPDDLLGLVLSASAEPLQIVQAQRYLDRLDRYPDLKPNENWHTSIIGLLNYPEVVTMMGDDLEWTEQLPGLVPLL